MKKGISHIFFFCLLFVLSCSSSYEKKCSVLKRGEFYYKGKGPLMGNIINRNDSVQMVTDEWTGEKTKERIDWIEPCTYVLYPLPGNEPGVLNSDLFPITVAILEVTANYYTVNVTSGNKKTEFNDTAWIVRLN